MSCWRNRDKATKRGTDGNCGLTSLSRGILPQQRLHGAAKPRIPQQAARAALQILRVQSAQELAEVAVAVGLAQNMAALRALATEGIQRGHMALHARNIALAAGAQPDEMEWLVQQMVARHDVRVDYAAQLLAQRRG